MKALFFIVNVLLAFISVLAYAAVYISPEYFWIAGFASYFIPFVLVLNIAFVIFWYYFSKIRMLLSVAILLLGFSFIKSTFTLTLPKKKTNTDFTVLSYNVKLFNAYGSHGDKTKLTAENIIREIKELHPDVLCFQEYYDNPKSSQLNATARLKAAGYKKHFFSSALRDADGAEFGMAVFTRFPIQGKGKIAFKTGSNNMAIYTDLVLQGKKIRFYNVHLESMSIDEKKIWNEEGTTRSKNLKAVYRKMKDGFKKRAHQIHLLEKEIVSSPYPVIICGDWNDLPYGYTYQRIKKQYNNAFEEAGNGFGFSFNGKLRFLRIDNQFASKSIRIVDYRTLYSSKHSDHYPILARYNLNQ